MTPRTVGRSSRKIDLASLALIFGGTALFLRAYVGMESVKNSPDVPFVRGAMEAYALTNQYLRLQQLSYIGLILVGAGIAIGLSAAAHHHKIGRTHALKSPTLE